MAVTETDDLTKTETAAAWRDLAQSKGWALFWEAIDAEWGAEIVLARMDQLLAKIARGDQEAINDTVQQLQFARREIQSLRQIPTMKLQQLTDKPTSKSPFAALRRTSR